MWPRSDSKLEAKAGLEEKTWTERRHSRPCSVVGKAGTRNPLSKVL